MRSLFARIRKTDPEVSLSRKIDNTWPDLDKKFISHELLAQLRSERGKSVYFKAKIDTGASISLFPMKYGEFLIENSEYISHDLYGVVKDPHCIVPVKIVKCNL